MQVLSLLPFERNDFMRFSLQTDNCTVFTNFPHVKLYSVNSKVSFYIYGTFIEIIDNMFDLT